MFKVLEISSKLEKEMLSEEDWSKMQIDLKAYNEDIKSFDNKRKKANIPPDVCLLLVH